MPADDVGTHLQAAVIVCTDASQVTKGLRIGNVPVLVEYDDPQLLHNGMNYVVPDVDLQFLANVPGMVGVANVFNLDGDAILSENEIDPACFSRIPSLHQLSG